MLEDPKWIGVAKAYLGVKEIPGPKDNPQIMKWVKTLALPFKDETVPWCGTFVGGVLVEAGYPIVANPAGARNWLKLKNKIDKPAVGAIVVFWRGSKSGYMGHVGFVVGRDRHGNIMVLGGNQGDMVSIKPFDLGRVLGYRWPGIAPDPSRYNLPIIASDGRVSQNEA